MIRFYATPDAATSCFHFPHWRLTHQISQTNANDCKLIHILQSLHRNSICFLFVFSKEKPINSRLAASKQGKWCECDCYSALLRRASLAIPLLRNLGFYFISFISMHYILLTRLFNESVPNYPAIYYRIVYLNEERRKKSLRFLRSFMDCVAVCVSECARVIRTKCAFRFVETDFVAIRLPYTLVATEFLFEARTFFGAKIICRTFLCKQRISFGCTQTIHLNELKMENTHTNTQHQAQHHSHTCTRHVTSA